MVADKIATVKTLINDSNVGDAIISTYLLIASGKMLERLYPYDSGKQESDLPARYSTLQCELAARLYLRRGDEGEMSHEENGVNRTYGSVDDEDILSRLTPYAKVGG